MTELKELLERAAEAALAAGFTPEETKALLNNATSAPIELPDHAARGHSPLGASGAERWMECPGSVSLLKHLELDESDEPDYRREGTAMHEAAAHCLESGLDTWEITGQNFNDTVIDAEMARHVQVYLDHVRPIMECAEEFWIESGLASPATHPLMYGSLDFGARLKASTACFDGRSVVAVVDLKGGEGIIVEPDDNPQLKYYAFLLIDQHPEWTDDMPVCLGIVQPRAFHQAGPIREWFTTVGAIRTWVRDILVPAMDATAVDKTLDAGPWCRFCPAKLVCPMLTGLYRAAKTCNPKALVNVTDESVGREYQYAAAVRFYLKALEEEAFKRLNLGKIVPGCKLVPKKSNRVWKSEAPALAKEKFGGEAMTTPELKSPAELEKTGPAAKAFVKEYAYMPQGGLTVALENDQRIEVKVKPTAETFAAAIAELNAT